MVLSHNSMKIKKSKGFNVYGKYNKFQCMCRS